MIKMSKQQLTKDYSNEAVSTLITDNGSPKGSDHDDTPAAVKLLTSRKKDVDSEFSAISGDQC